jgi:small subunit ribosomal protein S18
MRKWKKRQSPPTDAFDALDLNPLDLYKVCTGWMQTAEKADGQNFSIMSEYMTPMGRIKHRNQTGLRPVNQRRLAKAIRRAIGMGLMPSVHRHPEILADEAKGRMEGSSM